MKKTDIEIAADAIKYCRKKLNEYRAMIERAEKNNYRVSEKTFCNWTYEIEKIEFVLGERDKPPIPSWWDKECIENKGE